MFEIVVTEIKPAVIDDEADTRIERYRQTVDVLDLQKVMAAVNAKPRKPRVKKETK